MKDKISALLQIKGWAEKNLIRAVDYQFAAFVAEQFPLEETKQYLAALVSYELASGNVCLPRYKLQSAEQYWPEEMAQIIAKQDWSQLSADGQLLASNELTSPALIVCDEERFYLYRYWLYEVSVAEQLKKRACAVEVDFNLLASDLADLFPKNQEVVDWQKVAAAVAAQKRFSVISGGPGTGKTTTVIKLLALFIQQQKRQGKSVKIELAAPTGKAAARLAESISSAKQKLALSKDLADAIPAEASTLHRLLGVIPNSIGFKHDAENPLHLDLLVLDEASMVDLPMMARLLSAMPETSRLILLGDRDQLASVEAGSVLGDICSWPQQLRYSPKQSVQLGQLCQLEQPLEHDSTATFADCLAQLRKSYRFDDRSGIGFLARAVNEGKVDRVDEVLRSGYADLIFSHLSLQNYEQLIGDVVAFHADALRALKQGNCPGQQLALLGKMQLLCALRRGPYGVEGLNERVRKELEDRLLVSSEGVWYAGRPIMITKNDPSLFLFNGDIGVAMPDSDGRLKVWFDQQGEIRSVLPSRLPEHETVYAMTVHKSQGSEFDKVIFLLPPQETPLLCRELLYTGITRARKTLSLYATKQGINIATERKTKRAGGLAIRLWGSNGNSPV